ncbi:MAG TPA: AAA family ATPase [Gemmatimonadales bacterium]
MPVISVRTSGPVEILVDGGEPPPGLRWRKHTALLVYLLLSPRFSRTRSHLLGLLWADKSESAARHSLNEALRMLRKALGDDAVRTEGDLVSLDCRSIDCDALRFDAAITGVRWREAATLVAGDFLEGFDVPGAPAFEDWLSGERERRRAREVECLATTAAELLREGQVTDALRAAERAARLDPLSERAAAALMYARAVAGDAGAALEELARLERALATLGALPSAETRALGERIRRAPMPAIPKSRTAEARRTPLAGASRHLAALVDAMSASTALRRPALLVIEGDAGTGKSRLADELVVRARLAGAVASVARAIEADAVAPGGGLEALASGGLLEAKGVAGASPSSLAALASRLSVWGDRFPHLRAPAGDLGLARAFAGIVRTAADDQPLLLVVDDAHWLDPQSLVGLLGCIRDGGGAVTLLLTVDATHPRREIDECRARIGRDIAGAVVCLRPLELEAIAELTAWAMPDAEDAHRARLARRIHADSGGLPLLAVELLCAVRLGLELPETGPWPPPARTLDATRPGGLPDPVIAAIRIGYRRLGEDARAVLCTLAVLGGRASAQLIADAGSLDDERTLRALDELEWGRWLAAEPRGYGFTAAVAREVIARDMITNGQRQRILARAGRLTPP